MTKRQLTLFDMLDSFAYLFPSLFTFIKVDGFRAKYDNHRFCEISPELTQQ